MFKYIVMCRKHEDETQHHQTTSTTSTTCGGHDDAMPSGLGQAVLRRSIRSQCVPKLSSRCCRNAITIHSSRANNKKQTVEEHCQFFHAVWRIPVAEQCGHKPPPRPPHDSHRLMVCRFLLRAALSARRYPHTGRTSARVKAMSMNSPE